MASGWSDWGDSGSITPAGAPTPHKHKSHGILHNLLSDAVATAKGIPMGMVMTAKHPIRTVEAIGKSYADTYGHGWGHFVQTFKEHPLQPLLDAISVPLMLAGGAGAGVKAASAFADIGRSAEIATAVGRASKLAEAGDFAGADKLMQEASRMPKLKAAAQHFEKGTQHTTRQIDTGAGFSIPKAYSSNMFRRFMTKGTDAVLEGFVGGGIKGKGGVGFFSEAGKGRRMLQAEISRREAAAAGRSFGQARVLRQAEKANLDPAEVGRALQRDFVRVALKTGRKVKASEAIYLSNKDNLTAQFQYVAEDPFKAPTEAFVKDRGPDMSPSKGPGDLKGNIDPELMRELQREPGAVPLGPSAVDSRHYWDPGAARDKFRDEDVPAMKQEPYARFVAHPAKEGKDASFATKERTLQKHGEAEHKAFVEQLGGHLKYTDDPAKAWKDENGMVTIMRKGHVDALRRDIDGAMELAKRVYMQPLKVWKMFILGQSPRYFINNVIGNAGMYAVATNPVEFSRGFLEAVKSVHGVKAAARTERKMGNEVDTLMAKYLPDEFVHEEFGFLQHGALSLGQTLEKGRSPWGKKQMIAPLYSVTEKVSYRGPQRASIMGAMTTMPGFRKVMRANKKLGQSDHEAFQNAARTLLKDPRARATIEKRVTDWAGQYYHLNSLEQGITALVPFYNWTRHALRFGKEQVLSRPVSSSVLARLGALGDEEATKELGNLPDFLKGAIPVGGHAGGVLGILFGQSIRGREKVLLTAGYNPLSSGAEDARAIASLFGAGHAREGVSSQLNPIISGFLSGVTGEKLFSGAQQDAKGGPIGAAVSETFGQLPQARLLKAEFLGAPSTKTKKGEPTLYEKGVRQQLSSILGLNERDFSPKTAAKLYREQEGIKKGRKHRSKAAKDAERWAKALGSK